MSPRKINIINENSRLPPKTRCIKKIILNFILTRTGLLCIICLYLLAGAFLFQCLESRHEIKQQGLMQQQKINCLKELWIITEKFNVLYAKNWTRLAHQHIRNYEDHISELATNSNGIKNILNSHQRWTFIRSFHYSLSLVTTIGNTGLSPKTLQGKIFTMFYALLGIPLMFLLLSNCGYTIANALKLFCYKLYLYLYIENKEAIWIPDEESSLSIVPTAKQTIVEMRNGSNKPTTKLAPQRERKSCDKFENSKFHRKLTSTLPSDRHKTSISSNRENTANFISTEIPAAIAIFALFFYINLGGFMLAIWKDFSLLDASFFCFFSLTTIGYKDFKFMESSNEVNSFHLICSICIFTLIGLILVASIFIIVVDKNFLRCNLICSNLHKGQNIPL